MTGQRELIAEANQLTLLTPQQLHNFLGRASMLATVLVTLNPLLATVGLAVPSDRTQTTPLLVAEARLDLPANLQALIQQGEDYLLQERYPQALQAFSQVIGRVPTYAPAYILRGQTYSSMKLFELALQDMNRAIQLDPTSAGAIAARQEITRLYAETFLTRAEKFWQLQQNDRAIQEYSRALEIDPDYPQALIQRGELYREQGQFAKALDDLTRAIDLESAMTSQALVSRGFTYRLMGRGRHPQALQDFNQAIELDAQDSWAIAQRGYLYMVEENYSQALKDFNRALEINPEFTWALLSRGETYRLMGQMDEALKTINRALAIEPENAIALANRSYLYFFDLFNHKAAQRDVEQVLAQNPEDSDMLTLRGALALFYGDYARALASFERAIALNPEDAIALTNRGEIFLIRKQYEAAQASFNQALALDATDTWTQYLQALTSYAQGKSAQADRLVPDLLTQVELEYADEPDDWRGVINLAILNLLAKQPERASQLYRKAATSAPRDLLQEGYHDLNTFLSVFPKHPQALAMQTLLRPRLPKK